jgi:hypothetical protein
VYGGLAGHYRRHWARDVEGVILQTNGMESTNTVRMLWHGSPLSLYEELSLLSFVRCGHDVEIYSYDNLKVPDGVKLRDANEILAEKDVFCYTDGLAKGSFSAFSNLFRFKMLFEKGGIWSDPDVLCLRSLHALSDASVGRVGSKNFLNGAVLKFAKGNSICGELYAKTKAFDQDILLGQTGGLIMQAVERHPCSMCCRPRPSIPSPGTKRGCCSIRIKPKSVRPLLLHPTACIGGIQR